MSRCHQQKLWGIVLAGGEGMRARPFLQRLCGGRGIKQFCAVVGRRSMLEHTLARVERLIPRERILVVVSRHHLAEAAPQLAHRPAANVIVQPANRDTAPGILLPLAHISHRDPAATVAVFPSDHFVVDEATFMNAVAGVVAEVRRFPQRLVLLGATPEEEEGDYGWIEPAPQEVGRASRAVVRFVEKPAPAQVRDLMTRGALWNTFVFASRAVTLWEMIERTAPDLKHTFERLRLVLRMGSEYAPIFLKRAYDTMRAVNFSSEVCEPLVSWLRVLPAPEVGWSDWGSEERILRSLRKVGKLDECLDRLTYDIEVACMAER